MGFEPISKEMDEIASKIIDAAYTVHKALGPGLLESVYEPCFCHELKKRGLGIQTQVVLPITYDGMNFDAGLRLDVVVEDCLIVELKAVEKLHPVHEAQLLSYLRLTGKRLGLLINFCAPLIKDGIKRLVL